MDFRTDDKASMHMHVKVSERGVCISFLGKLLLRSFFFCTRRLSKPVLKKTLEFVDDNSLNLGDMSNINITPPLPPSPIAAEGGVNGSFVG